MTGVVILLLIASNVLLARMLLKKSPAADEGREESGSASVAENIAPAQDNVLGFIGSSTYDPDSFRALVKDVAREVVPLVIEEYGTLADAGLPDYDTFVPNTPRIPDEKLDDVFTNMTVSDLTGETLDAAEPRAEGLDFESLDTTMKVLREESDNPEDVNTARETLRSLDGTVLKETIELDPSISRRILMIELDLSELNAGNKLSPEKETGESVSADEAPEDADKAENTGNESGKRKLVYHANIDTSGIDAINFNVYH